MGRRAEEEVKERKTKTAERGHDEASFTTSCRPPPPPPDTPLPMTEPSLFSRFLGADDSLPPPPVMTSTETSSTGAPTAPAATGPTTPHATTSVPAPIKNAPPRSPVSHPEMCVCEWETGVGWGCSPRVCVGWV